MKIDFETEFFSGLIELQHGLNVKDKLVKLSKKVSWAKGWPKDNKAFWSAEAFMWEHKIGGEKRKLIKEELAFLENGKNLDLGCGSYSYIKSTGFDFSEKMLQFNDNCVEKVVGDLEQKLPFKTNSFDSITAIFVLNYVHNYSLLLGEIKRILEEDGIFVMVLGNVNDWQKQKEVNSFSLQKWKEILTENDFKEIKYFEKEGLWFFRCSN
jgi:ubiquinone/menaquinone biosynthesis C-methylase UbiE